MKLNKRSPLRTTSLLKLWEEEPGGKKKPRRNFFKSLKLRRKEDLEEVEVKERSTFFAPLPPIHNSRSTWKIERVQVDYITK